MTKSIGRFWATAVALVVFFILWAVVAARPWVSSGTAPTNPRLAALQAREQKLQTQAIAAQQTLNKRWAAYRAALLRHQGSLKAAQRAQLAAAPPGPSVVVKVTGAAPITHTTSSGVVVPSAPTVPALPGQTAAAGQGAATGGSGGFGGN